MKRAEPKSTPSPLVPADPSGIEGDSVAGSGEYLVLPATAADFPRLGRIETVCDAQFPQGRFPHEPGSDNLSLSDLETGAAEGLLWIAVTRGSSAAGTPEAADRALGFALCVRRDPHLHLLLLAVDPGAQRRGLGGRLLDRVFREAETLGCSATTLTTFEDIPWNAPYYRRRGFQKVGDGELTPGLREDLDAETAAGMTRRIAMLRPTRA